MHFVVLQVDPLGDDALMLLREAAIFARDLYPELHHPNDPWPTNGPNPPRGAYFIAYIDEMPIAMGSHRPIDDRTTELRRIFTLELARRTGAAKAIISAVEQHAIEQGFVEIKLETGYRQLPAMQLYESLGYDRIEPFGEYINDPTSVCFAKLLQ